MITSGQSWRATGTASADRGPDPASVGGVGLLLMRVPPSWCGLLPGWPHTCCLFTPELIENRHLPLTLLRVGAQSWPSSCHFGQPIFGPPLPAPQVTLRKPVLAISFLVPGGNRMMGDLEMPLVRLVEASGLLIEVYRLLRPRSRRDQITAELPKTV